MTNSNPTAESVVLTVSELARACHVTEAWIIERVDTGLIDVDTAGGPTRWRFVDTHLSRVRCMVSMERQMDANPELAALVADLVEQVRQLRGRLKGIG